MLVASSNENKTVYGFEQFLLVRKGLQPLTIIGYLGSVKKFIESIGTHYPTHHQVEEYVARYFRGGYSYSHITNTSLALERWMEYIQDPIRLGRQKKPKTIIKDTLSEAEVTKLIFNCNNTREMAMLTLLSYSGVRNHELCNLRVRDVDFGNNRVRVVAGKGRKDGFVCITGAATKILMQYLAECQRPQEQYLFTTLQYGNRLATQDVRKIIRIIAKRSAMKKRVFPQLLRHSLAVNMLMRGAGIYTIKEQLRHSFVETTLGYVNSILYTPKGEYEKFAPSYV